MLQNASASIVPHLVRCTFLDGARCLPPRRLSSRATGVSITTTSVATAAAVATTSEAAAAAVVAAKAATTTAAELTEVTCCTTTATTTTRTTTTTTEGRLTSNGLEESRNLLVSFLQEIHKLPNNSTVASVEESGRNTGVSGTTGS